MYFKKLFILLLVSSSLGYSYAEEVPDNIKTLANSIVRIKQYGFVDQNKTEMDVVYGTGFLIKDENGQLRVVTNFHVIEKIVSKNIIVAQNLTNSFLLRLEAISSLHDIALLRVEGTHEHLGELALDSLDSKSQNLYKNIQAITQEQLNLFEDKYLEKPLTILDVNKHLGKPLELREQPPEWGERLYTLGFKASDDDNLLRLILISYIGLRGFQSEMVFLLNTPNTTFNGMSGSPIIDKTGKVVGIFSGNFNNKKWYHSIIDFFSTSLSYNRWYNNGIGTTSDLFNYSTNKDFIKCPKSMDKQFCIIQSKLKLLQKMQSSDPRIRIAVQNLLVSYYGKRTVREFRKPFTVEKEKSGKKLDLQALSQLFDKNDPRIRNMLESEDYTIADFIHYIQKRQNLEKAPDLQELPLQFTKEDLAEEKTIKPAVSGKCKNAVLK